MYWCPVLQISYTLHEQDYYKFLVSVFITECHGEARRQSAKNAGVLAMDEFPVCGTLRRTIAHRMNVHIRIGEAHSIFTRFSESNWAMHFAKLIDLRLGCPCCPGLCRDLFSVSAGEATFSATHPLTWQKAPIWAASTCSPPKKPLWRGQNFTRHFTSGGR